jgi:hypothetical protein
MKLRYFAMATTARSWREFISGADRTCFRVLDAPFVNVGSSQAPRRAALSGTYN